MGVIHTIPFRGDIPGTYRPIGDGADSQVFVDDDHTHVLKWYAYLQRTVDPHHIVAMLTRYIADTQRLAEHCTAASIKLPLPNGTFENAALQIIPQGSLALADDGVPCLTGQPFIPGRNFCDLYHQGSPDAFFDAYRGNKPIFDRLRLAFRLATRSLLRCEHLEITPLNAIPTRNAAGECTIAITDTCANVMRSYGCEIDRPTSIERARPGDGAGIARVQESAWIDTYANPTIGLTKELITSREFTSPAKIASWEAQIEHSGDDHLMLVARCGDDIGGYCIMEKTKNRAELCALYLLPSLQRRGLGKKLVENALEWIGDDRMVTLTVFRDNAQAIAFYEKCGFTSTGVTGSMTISGVVIPDVQLGRRAC